jgi:hypothetical protein
MGRPRPRARTLSAASALILGGCDIPTELPKGWDNEFQFQLEGVSLSVGQLLPSGLPLTPDGGAFGLVLEPASLSESVGNLCPACAAAEGLTIPKPAFRGSFAGGITLPADVEAASLVTGRVRVTITNGLNFDPLRPGAGARGTLTITLRSSGTPLAPPRVIDGEARALPPGSTLTEDMEVGDADLTETITVSVEVDSPPGAAVRMETAGRLSATAVPAAFRASSAEVTVTGRQIGSAPVGLDLTDVDDLLRDRVRRGALLMSVTNPFEVIGAVTVHFSGPGVHVVKPLDLGPGTDAHEIPLSGTELRSMLGSRMAVSLSGAVWSLPGGVSVTPSQALSVGWRLHLVVGPKG